MIKNNTSQENMNIKEPYDIRNYAKVKIKNHRSYCNDFIVLKVVLTIFLLVSSLSSITFISLIVFYPSTDSLFDLIALFSSVGALLFQLILYFVACDRKIAFHNEYLTIWQNFYMQLLYSEISNDEVLKECNRINIEEANIWNKYIVSI